MTMIIPQISQGQRFCPVWIHKCSIKLLPTDKWYAKCHSIMVLPLNEFSCFDWIYIFRRISFEMSQSYDFSYFFRNLFKKKQNQSNFYTSITFEKYFFIHKNICRRFVFLLFFIVYSKQISLLLYFYCNSCHYLKMLQ